MYNNSFQFPSGVSDYPTLRTGFQSYPGIYDNSHCKTKLTKPDDKNNFFGIFGFILILLSAFILYVDLTSRVSSFDSYMQTQVSDIEVIQIIESSNAEIVNSQHYAFFQDWLQGFRTAFIIHIATGLLGLIFLIIGNFRITSRPRGKILIYLGYIIFIAMIFRYFSVALESFEYFL